MPRNDRRSLGARIRRRGIRMLGSGNSLPPAEPGPPAEIPTPESVLAVLREHGKPLKMREIADRLSYATNAPWAVVFAVKQLERDGLVTWDRKRPNRVSLVEREGDER